MDDLREQLNETYLGILKVMEKRYEWLKTILAVVAGIVGALVALKGGQSKSWLEYWLFCTTISLFCIGILIGCAALYGEHMKLLLIQKEAIRSLMSRLDPTSAPPKEFENPVWGRMEIACAICLVLAMMAMLAYAFVSSQPSC